jgi:hypothetical protein
MRQHEPGRPTACKHEGHHRRSGVAPA